MHPLANIVLFYLLHYDVIVVVFMSNSVESMAGAKKVCLSMKHFLDLLEGVQVSRLLVSS